MRKSLLSKAEIVAAYEVERLTIAEVSHRARIAPRTVRIHLADCGARMRKQGPQPLVRRANRPALAHG